LENFEKMSVLQNLKDLVGRLPWTAELNWLLRGRKVPYHFNLNELEDHIPQVLQQVAPFAKDALPGKKIFIFIATHYWIEQAVQMGFALTGLGHQVTIGYLPNSYWNKRINRFDLQMQNLYARSILEKTRPWLNPVSILDIHGHCTIPEELQKNIDRVTLIDTQYVNQDETVTEDNPIFRMRLQTNTHAARAAMIYLTRHRPDVVLTPNGLIMEFGAVYEVARFLNIRTVTYEFGDAANHIWIAQDIPVVCHDTDGLWAARRNSALDNEQKKWLEDFFNRRQQPAADSNFVWLSQPADPKGGNQTRLTLGLDSRPVVVLATNVLGDSLTLGRQIFSPTMIEWVKRTVEYFVNHPEVQLVIRIHPGEKIMVGPTSASEVIRQVLPDPPEHIHVISAGDPINTYDLLDITDLGLVYVTTAGLEMVTRGIPVIVGGRTHYRGRGFTIDPDTWEGYFAILDQTLARLPFRLSQSQLDLAWNYAYRFFREFPQPYPWHLAKRWQDFEERPLRYVLGDGLVNYETTFRYLVGEEICWGKNSPANIIPIVDAGGNETNVGDILRRMQEE
jgi:hypothetical protein